MNAGKDRLTPMTFDILFVPGTDKPYGVFLRSNTITNYWFTTKDEAQAFVDRCKRNITRVTSRQEG